MNRLLLSIAAFVLAIGVSSAHAQPPFSQFSILNAGTGAASSSGGSSVSPTSPGGTVAGANQFRTVSGTFGGDDLILNDGLGNMNFVSGTVRVNASNEMGMLTISSTNPKSGQAAIRINYSNQLCLIQRGNTTTSSFEWRVVTDGAPCTSTAVTGKMMWFSSGATITEKATINNAGVVPVYALEVGGAITSPTISTSSIILRAGTTGAQPYACTAALKGAVSMASDTVMNTCNGTTWQNPSRGAAIW